MVNFLDINNCDYLYLSHYSEPEENSLILVIEEAGPTGPEKDAVIVSDYTIRAKEISTSNTHRRFVLYFDVYVAFHILNESYGAADPETDKWEGKIARKYSKSSLLNYINQTSLTDILWEDPLFHHSVFCLDHLVEVISLQAPEVRQFEANTPVEESIESIYSEFIETTNSKKHYIVEH